MYQCEQYQSMFTSKIDKRAPKDTEVIIDFLKYIHMGPSENCKTYEDFSSQLWSHCVSSLGLQRADEVAIVIDKPEQYKTFRAIVKL